MVVVTRVKQASCTVNNEIISSIKQGFLLLVGFKNNDTILDLEHVAKKIAKLRIFSDEFDKMNLSLDKVNGEILAISQFTLYGSVKDSNRPSFTESMKYDLANKYYEDFCEMLKKETNTFVYKGVFGENMAIESVNDGPVTIIIDSEKL